MRHQLTRTGAIVVGFVAIVAALTLPGFIGASRNNSPDVLSKPAAKPDMLPATVAAVLEKVGFEPLTSRAVALDTYLVKRHAHGESLLCLVSTYNDRTSSGCNPEADFFAGRSVVWSMDEEGKPHKPAALWISGVAKPVIRTIRVGFGATAIEAVVSDDGGFFIKAPAEVLAQGRPQTLEGIDADGNVIESTSLPRD